MPDRNEFLELPKEEERVRKLNEWMGTKLHDGKAMDEEFRTFEERGHAAAMIEKAMLDADEPHPTEEGRTKLGDLSNALANASAKQEKRGRPGEINSKDALAAIKSVLEEYGFNFTPDQDNTRLKARWQGLKDMAEKYEEELEAKAQAAKEDGEEHAVNEDVELTNKWLTKMQEEAEADPDQEAGAVMQ